ncbi:sirohydrochlorin chelatase [Desulfallas thermosapovorans]|uniref:CbiX protein n=1 Tax=Desulfallas thermosapovorans DSM 6562 TaxID=1121431 RepID=A0A5S4ZY11_9FIRM|nr:CbiX/SirB N-terminal domain-containing protein [Desulfallas thermosapovorans]TYO97745.1 CbiX protein [Desulfallas thermosapovorans DSM 6562]
MKTGVIILSHGSRLPEAQATLQKITAMVESSANEDFLIEGAALQFNQPDLPTAIARIIDRGAERVVVVPLFLYLGLHMQRDIPEILAAQRNLYPNISISMSEHIGADPRLQEIIMDRVRGAVI